ncbi:hypothetical protein WR25_19481 [Diploscapter pachys]|uniref:Aminopeptidase P N-terminal domain-containing protein n=1 Tax=Diploscapter pachys TaxID=2018661 RepID=A0A2A2K0M6_9BILA|nr:hypothetical protein WR25_19481 [Diploscapter pachys]
MSYYWMKGNTLKVPATLFKKNRDRLVAELKKKVDGQWTVLLQGGREKLRYNTDCDDLPFRQESYFFWTFGVHESEFFGAIDVDTGKSVLFAPKLDPSYAIWDGKINDENFFKTKYEVDEVYFNDGDSIAALLKQHLKAEKLLLLKADNTDSGNVLEVPSFKDVQRSFF